MRFHELVMRPAFQQALELVVQAGERKESRFDIAYEAKPWMVEANISELMTLNKVVQGEAAHLINLGEHSNAWVLAVAGLQFTKAKQAEPVLISQLVSIAIYAIGETSLRQICSAEPLTQDVYTRIINVLKSIDQPEYFLKSLDGDRLLIGEWMYAHAVPRAWTQNKMPWAQYIGRLIWSPVIRLDHAAYLQCFRLMAAAASSRELPSIHVPAYCVMTRELYHSIVDYRERYRIYLAHVRCTETGLAVLMYKKVHGTWPEALAACMDQLPLDPFNGQPLRYRLMDKGFVVSSVGMDGRARKEIAWQYEPETR